jgi:hypothetical protein
MKSEFVWTTASGEDYHPSLMEARHLYNCTRLVYNNLVPSPDRRIEGGREDTKLFDDYDKDYLYDAMRAFIAEIYARLALGSQYTILESIAGSFTINPRP